jgi:predicted Zn-dependent protease
MKRFFVLTGSLAALGFTIAAAAQQPPLPAGTTTEEAREAAQRSSTPPLAEAESDIALQNYDAARKLIDPWIAAHPADARALFDRGYIEDAQEHPDLAIADYQKSIAADPKQFEPRLSLGLLLARQGHPKEAIEQLTTAVTLEPDPPNPGAQAQAFRALARLERSSDPAAAKEHLLAALKLGPEQPDDVLLTAEIAAANEDDETAEAAYRRVLARQPESSAATAGLVHLLIKQKKYAGAEPLLRAALVRDPDDPALNSQLASVLTYEDKNDEAVAVLERLHRLEPEDPLIGGMLADAYTRNGTPEKAGAILDELVKKHPQNADLLSARGDNLLEQHRYPEAIEAFQAALKISPDTADNWMKLAIAASQDKQYTLVLNALSTWTKYSSENPGSNFLMATAYDNLHRNKEAVEYYQKFLASSAGKFPDQEWEARHRLIALGVH